MKQTIDDAVELFMNGYNCAQATATPFAERCGFSSDDILKMSAGFGGGMGGLREQCGAVSAMVMLAGISFGSYDQNDTAAKKRLYDTVKAMHAEFVARHKTTNCRELLTSASCAAPADPSERTAAYYAKRPCARFVRSAAEIIAKHLSENL